MFVRLDLRTSLVLLISSYSVSGKKIVIPTVWVRIPNIPDKPLTINCMMQLPLAIYQLGWVSLILFWN